MIAVDGLITDVSRHLSDYDSTHLSHSFVEWTRRDLESYMQIASAMLASAVPNAFAKQVSVSLTGQDPIVLPEECEQYLGTVAYIDANGKRHTGLREVAEAAAGAYKIQRNICVDDAESAVPSVTKSASNADSIILDPAPKSGTLIVNCMKMPAWSGSAEIDVPARFRPVLFFLMVSLAFGTDIEAAPMRALSDTYWNRAFDLLLVMQPTATRPARPK